MNSPEGYIHPSDEFADQEARRQALLEKLHAPYPAELDEDEKPAPNSLPSSVLPLPPIITVDSQSAPGRYTGTDV